MGERALFTIGAFAVIFNEIGQVLLSHRRDMDAWNLPGGGLECEELPSECVIREVQEETGLLVEVDRLIGIYGKTGRNEIVFAFVCRVTGGSLCETAESDACQYYDVDALPPNTLKKHALRVFDALNESRALVFRKEAATIRK